MGNYFGEKATAAVSFPLNVIFCEQYCSVQGVPEKIIVFFNSKMKSPSPFFRIRKNGSDIDCLVGQGRTNWGPKELKKLL